MPLPSNHVLLWRRKIRGGAFRAPGHCETALKSSLPFYRSKQGFKIHRVRSVTVYWRDGQVHHTAFSLWLVWSDRV